MAASTPRAVSASGFDPRKIAAKCRRKLARDRAIALSHESSIFSSNSAAFGAEAGA